MAEDSHSGTKDEVRRLAAAGLTVTEIARELRVSKPTVCFHLKSLGIKRDSRFSRRYDWAAIREYYDAGHSMSECQARFGFAKASWSQAVARGDIIPRPRALPAAELFVLADERVNRYHLKRRLLGDRLKQARCEECGIDRWRDRPLSLELHHINGDGRDNRLENLAILCPNCHSQTDNWGGRNARRGSGSSRA